MVDTRLCASAHAPDSRVWMLRFLVLPFLSLLAICGIISPLLPYAYSTVSYWP
jgi:hypothetical protein